MTEPTAPRKKAIAFPTVHAEAHLDGFAFRDPVSAIRVWTNGKLPDFVTRAPAPRRSSPIGGPQTPKPMHTQVEGMFQGRAWRPEW